MPVRKRGADAGWIGHVALAVAISRLGERIMRLRRNGYLVDPRLPFGQNYPQVRILVPWRRTFVPSCRPCRREWRSWSAAI
jgi:hypothetical protein